MPEEYGKAKEALIVCHSSESQSKQEGSQHTLTVKFEEPSLTIDDELSFWRLTSNCPFLLSRLLFEVSIGGTRTTFINQYGVIVLAIAALGFKTSTHGT